MRRTTPAVTALTGAVIALALTGCGGAAAQQQASAPAHVTLAAAQAPASAGASAASGSAAAAGTATGSRSGSSSHSKHGTHSGSAKAPAASSAPAPASAAGAGTASRVNTAAGTGGGGGGGGKVPPVAPPADWPATVPIPAGTITGASGKSPQWIINETVKGLDTVSIARITTLYTKAGFKVDPTISFPKVLRRNRLVLTIVWRNRDHGPEATEVQLNLARV